MKKFFRSARNYLKRLNLSLLLACLIACGFSVVLLYTMLVNNMSTSVKAHAYEMQIAMTALGFAIALIISAIDCKLIIKIWPLYVSATLILSLLLFTPLGITVEGSDDIGWLNIGFTQIQPSEFLKVAFILTFSAHLTKAGREMNRWNKLIPLLVHGIFPAGLIALQGDDGTVIVFFLIFIFMLFAAGLWWRYVLAILAMVPAGAYVIWNYLLQPFQKTRFLVVYDKQIQAEQLQDKFFQQNSGLTALGSGQLTGKGLIGQNYNYVFSMQSDFIFSYIGMTLGFIGCVAAISLLLFICAQILRVAINAKDDLGRNICIGAFAMIFSHTVINIGMVLAVVPVIGIPLPFISAGGSSVLALYSAVGLVLSVQANKNKKWY